MDKCPLTPSLSWNNAEWLKGHFRPQTHAHGPACIAKGMRMHTQGLINNVYYTILVKGSIHKIKQ